MRRGHRKKSKVANKYRRGKSLGNAPRGGKKLPAEGTKMYENSAGRD